MKRFILIILGFILFISCEDVIEVELPENDTRLVVNGVIRVDENQEFLPIEIAVSESSSFFDENTVASLKSAIIYYGTPNADAPEILEGGGISNLAEVEPGSGIWVPDPSFDSDQRIRVSSIEEGDVFQLILETENEQFFATTTYVKSVPIDSLEQGDETLFSGDETEVIVTFTDPGESNDFYLLDLDFGEFLVTEDEFYQGQTFVFSYFYDNELAINTSSVVNISLLGVDEQFYNYMNQIIVQSGGDQGPFQTPAATVRGNIINVTGIDNDEVVDNVERSDNFALGYFAIVEEYTDSITITNNEEN
ncbi:MAG: DUF4249 family protein [Maribacter dokdonensis]|uniref:DUF4249 domain-containing protein n=2 Tax=Maribacter TaxID=252356 RepID=A0A1H4T829_9FLAO|nr:MULTISPECIES: DUF4249 family protein [Maribacter]KSA14005.1 hypothetical protein I600_598 [Maribacter dokdonensis DSW-8]SEC52261.1 protein of unknown function [Maribacter dokdonensis]HAF78916.1 DUF4249 domain-containing protein [Maribacter sp.]|tara:strand:+ start:176510 stop:177430 length:921 start_codon:yes stop_codon:yes gene_type:complete